MKYYKEPVGSHWAENMNRPSINGATTGPITRIPFCINFCSQRGCLLLFDRGHFICPNRIKQLHNQCWTFNLPFAAVPLLWSINMSNDKALLSHCFFVRPCRIESLGRRKGHRKGPVSAFLIVKPRPLFATANWAILVTRRGAQEGQQQPKGGKTLEEQAKVNYYSGLSCKCVTTRGER